MITLATLTVLGLLALTLATILTDWSDPPCRLCCGDRDREGPWCTDCLEAL